MENLLVWNVLLSCYGVRKMIRTNFVQHKFYSSRKSNKVPFSIRTMFVCLLIIYQFEYHQSLINIEYDICEWQLNCIFRLLMKHWSFLWHDFIVIILYSIHRNTFSRKYRRHLSDGSQRSSANLGSIEKGTERSTVYRVTHTISQLRVDLSDMHVDHMGRVEVTCLATIPARVAQGEQYADYRTVSERSE